MSVTLKSALTLRDGVKIPQIGFGLFKVKDGQEAVDAIAHALKAGYRLLDSAHLYGNQVSVGTGVRDSGLPRDQVFVVDKLWIDSHGEKLAAEAVEKSLARMELTYIDLYLIHDPRGEKLVETFRTLLKYKERGLIKSVGVSNFGVHHLEALRAAGLEPPSVNQVELHPWQNQLKRPLVDYCHINNIAMMAYCPLVQNKKSMDPQVLAMASKYKKSWAQVLIRWSLQRGFIPLPKSSNPTRIQENADVFDFTLSDDDMSILDTMPHEEVIWDRTAVPYVD